MESWRDAEDPLNERERKVSRLPAGSRADIAKLMHRSAGTVRNYLSEAIAKLIAGNRFETFVRARCILALV
jgi:two-component system response regulator DesR